MVGGMTAMIRSRFATPTVGREGLVGEMGTAEVDVAPDGVVRIRDARWRAAHEPRDADPVPVMPVRVVSIDGLVLEVEPETGGATRDPHVDSPTNVVASDFPGLVAGRRSAIGSGALPLPKGDTGCWQPGRSTTLGRSRPRAGDRNRRCSFRRRGPSGATSASCESRERRRSAATCAVRVACLEYALQIREPHGIWGGLTENERRAVLDHASEIAGTSRGGGVRRLEPDGCTGTVGPLRDVDLGERCRRRLLQLPRRLAHRARVHARLRGDPTRDGGRRRGGQPGDARALPGRRARARAADGACSTSCARSTRTCRLRGQLRRDPAARVGRGLPARRVVARARAGDAVVAAPAGHAVGVEHRCDRHDELARRAEQVADVGQLRGCRARSTAAATRRRASVERGRGEVEAVERHDRAVAYQGSHDLGGDVDLARATGGVNGAASRASRNRRATGSSPTPRPVRAEPHRVALDDERIVVRERGAQRGRVDPEASTRGSARSIPCSIGWAA